MFPKSPPLISMAEYTHLVVRTSYGSTDDHPACNTSNWQMGVGPRTFQIMRLDANSIKSLCPRCLQLATDEFVETHSMAMDLPQSFHHLYGFEQGGVVMKEDGKIRQKCLEAVKALLDEDDEIVEYTAEFTKDDDPRLPEYNRGGDVMRVTIKLGGAS